MLRFLVKIIVGIPHNFMCIIYQEPLESLPSLHIWHYSNLSLVTLVCPPTLGESIHAVLLKVIYCTKKHKLQEDY